MKMKIFVARMRNGCVEQVGMRMHLLLHVTYCGQQAGLCVLVPINTLRPRNSIILALIARQTNNIESNNNYYNIQIENA